MMYFVIPDKEWYSVAFSDLDNNQRIIKMNKVYNGVTCILNIINKHKFFNNIFSRLFYKVYPFENIIRRDSEVILCFTDNSLKSINRKYLFYLKKKYKDVKMIPLMYNKISLLYNEPGNIQLYELPDDGKSLPFDYIFTYDLDDSKILGLPNYELYSKYDGLNTESQIKKNDIFYCGSVAHLWKKSRYDLVKEIFERLFGMGVDCNFHMTFEHDAKNIDCEFKETKRLSYIDILNYNLQSNVILEIVSDGKYGPTFRYCEAVVYNIKLLTNNPNITQMPFYNSNYMKFFSRAEDIDIEWVKRVEKVDYGYNGEFSPKVLWSKIK